MSRPPWDESLKARNEVWGWDGSLRDVYVLDTTLDDWRAVVAVLTAYPHQWTRDGEPITALSVDSLFAGPLDASFVLGCGAGGATVNCHFFSRKVIALDLDPREVSGSVEHDAVLNLLERVARAVGKTVFVAPEGALNLGREVLRGAVYLSFDPSADRWQVHSPAFGPGS